jgi:hypothetical protein
MPSKNNLKRCVSATKKKSANSQKSDPQEGCCAEKPWSDEGSQVPTETAASPAEAAGEEQAAEKESAEIVAALAKTAGSSGFFGRKNKSRLPRPRVRLAEAMRARGLDEHFIARVVLMFFRARVSQKKFDKLFVDMVEKVIRVLEPPRPSDRSAAEAPTPVQLIHYVDRPDRENPSDYISDPTES